MGYYTRFNLNVEPEDYREIVVEELRNLGGSYVANILEEEWGDSMKWYEWEDDMRNVASKVPEAVIILDGEGEEQGDKWRAFFQGEKMELHQQPAWSPPAKPAWSGDCGC